MRRSSSVLAVLLIPALAWPQGAATGLTRIGAAAAVQGLIKATAPGQVGRVVSSGKPLFLHDRVTSDAKGRMQVLLLDETVFTLGPNADMVLDEFVYDPNTSAGKVTARITKGAFRFVTGKVARKDPANMKVKLAVGTIGIRGTVVMGETGSEGSTVINAGAGDQNNAGEQPSALFVENEGTTVEVDQTGQGTTMTPGQPPAPPTDMSQQMGELSQNLESQGGSGGGGTGSEDSGQSATDAAGQSTAAGGSLAGDAGMVQETNQAVGTNLTQAIQDATEGLSGNSTWEQIRNSGQAGIAGFQASGLFTQTTCSGSPCSNAGSWDYLANIDFGAREVNYSVSMSAGSISGGVGGTQNFDALSGNAAFSDASGGFSVQFQFLNANGVPAGQLQGTASYFDSSSGVNAGSGEVLTSNQGPEVGF